MAQSPSQFAEHLVAQIDDAIQPLAAAEALAFLEELQGELSSQIGGRLDGLRDDVGA